MHLVYPSEVLMGWNGSGRTVSKEGTVHCEFVEAEQELQMLLSLGKATGLVC